MTRLSVNINKIATLRNARGENNPDVQRFAEDCERMGAQGITVHPRPDERHIRRDDVYKLRPLVKTEFNIEGYPSPEFMDLVVSVRPEQVTLVPDKPDVLTSSAGWDVEPESRVSQRYSGHPAPGRDTLLHLREPVRGGDPRRRACRG